MKRLIHLTLIFTLLLSCVKKESNKKKQDINPMYLKAGLYLDSNNLDSAFKYFSEANDFFISKNDKLWIAKSLVNMGYIAHKAGDYFSAQEFSLQALKYFDNSDTAQYIYLSPLYNTLGQSSHQLTDYQKAIKFYERAISYETDSGNLSIYLNNQGKSYEEMGNYESALKIYNQAVKTASKNSSNYARIITNIALAKSLQNPAYNPKPLFFEALKIRKTHNDIDGLNSSYAHLSDSYKNTNRDSAFFYAKQMLSITKQTRSAEDKLRALRKLSLVSPANESKKYYIDYLFLLDSLENVRNNSKNQFALIRYEAEKHKNNFLLAQNENIKKRNNIIQLIFVAVVLVGLLIFGYFAYRKRKRQLQQEKALEVKNTELKYVKKVHDRVANNIYGVMSEIEYKPELDRENILDKLSHIYNTSRDISHEITDPNQRKNFSKQLADMLNNYVADPPYVKVNGNEDEIWANVSGNTKGEVFIVLQEFMTNMKKHSQATEVNIDFIKDDKSISIHYHDNGIGLPKNVIYNNGLRNTETRIKNISGTLTFDTTAKQGLGILISFPAN